MTAKIANENAAIKMPTKRPRKTPTPNDNIVKLKTGAPAPVLFAPINHDLTNLQLRHNTPCTVFGLITPPVAVRMLACNRKNRAVPDGTLAVYENDMTTDRWIFNGDAIRFDVLGDLIDGQTRLRACVSTGKSFWAILVLGLEERAMDVIDIGRPRSLADLIAIHEGGAAKGKGHEFALAAVCGWLLRIKRQMDIGVKSKTMKLESLEIYRRHPQLIGSIKKTRRMVGKRPSLASAIHYTGILMETPELADRFLHSLQTGEPDYKDCAAAYWHSVIVKAMEHGAIIERHRAFPGMIRAWNQFRLRRSFGSTDYPTKVEINGLDLDKI